MGKKEKKEFVQPVIKKYRVEVHNKSSDPIKVIIGNLGHCIETKVPAKGQWPRVWDISFTDVPDIKIITENGKKAFGLRESHQMTNSFVIEDDNIVCKNSNPLPPRRTAASPEIYGSNQETHYAILANTSRKECSYHIGDDWHNITGTLDSGYSATWQLVIAQLGKVTHHWCKIEELGSRRNKFSLVGVRSLDGKDMDDVDLDYRDHKFEINDNLELLRDGGPHRLWKFDWE